MGRFEIFFMAAEALATEIIRKVRKHIVVVINEMHDMTNTRKLCELLRITPRWKRKQYT